MIMPLSTSLYSQDHVGNDAKAKTASSVLLSHNFRLFGDGPKAQIFLLATEEVDVRSIFGSDDLCLILD